MSILLLGCIRGVRNGEGLLIRAGICTPDFLCSAPTHQHPSVPPVPSSTTSWEEINCFELKALFFFFFLLLNFKIMIIIIIIIIIMYCPIS